ncbi:MAG: cysteine--tRNA ligase [Lachnospiraceae bacterium]|nr:cysteine--tRNA ligase [Lachnospiraceae bacterium]
MQIYNTMTKKKETFEPLEPGHVRMYVCGPTVYNLIHIGNARPMIVFDTVRRYFAYKGMDVSYVSNFTDVDDKIINEANAQGIDAGELAEHFIVECKKDMEALHVMPATVHPLATQEIPEMIELISTLIDKGFAYEKNGTVYFSTRKFKPYGKLSHKNLDDLRAGERDLKVTGEDEKEDALDFVLWKPKKEGEPFWKSPWGDGRPGWHTECSAMAKKYLGDSIDIHAGGEDLIFPHHENEIAQSEAANDVEFARYWMHNGFLNIDNKKMSKSLGNFFTVRDILAQYDPQVVRFFMLNAHYRSPLNFSRELMEAAKASWQRIVTARGALEDAMKSSEDADMTKEEKTLYAQTDAFVSEFERSMEDDFNTADAMAAIFELVKFVNIALKDTHTKDFIEALKERMDILLDVMGLNALIEQGDLSDEIEAMIEKRQQARKAKDFATADAIRDELLAKGIVLEDTREGVKWHKA